MREIKARSWISSIQRFVYFKNGNYSHKNSNGKNLFDWDIAEQDTGLKDKNGVEIYEGDILYLSGYGYLEVLNITDILAELLACGQIYPTDYRDHKIVGNKHENKELLES